MKILTVLLALTIASSAFARPGHTRPPRHPSNGGSSFSEITLENSTIQTIAYAVANALAVTSAATSEATSNSRKMEAVRIQNDIMDYDQTGLISPLLADKINLVNSIQEGLSEQEAIDVLVIATDSLLN